METNPNARVHVFNVYSNCKFTFTHIKKQIRKVKNDKKEINFLKFLNPIGKALEGGEKNLAADIIRLMGQNL